MKCNKIKLVLIESVPKSVKAVQQQYHSLVLRDEMKTITKNLDLHLSSYHFQLCSPTANFLNEQLKARQYH